MAAASFAARLTVPQRSFRNLVELFAKEAMYEVVKNVRIPIYAVSTVAFPLMFYVLFGIVLSRSGTRAGLVTGEACLTYAFVGILRGQAD